MNYFLRILIASSLLSILLIVQIVSAQSLPVLNPPAGNVSPTVQTIETINNTEIGGTLKIGNTLEPLSGTTLGLKGNVNISKSLDVSQDVTVNGKFSVPEAFTVDLNGPAGSQVKIEKPLSVMQPGNNNLAANFYGNVYVDGFLAPKALVINDIVLMEPTNTGKKAIFSSNVFMEKDLYVINGNIRTNSILPMSGDQADPIDIGGVLQVDVLKAATGGIVVDDTLKVNKTLNVVGSLKANTIGQWALSENELDLKKKINGFHSIVAVCPPGFTIVSCNSHTDISAYTNSSPPPVFHLGSFITPDKNSCTAKALKVNSTQSFSLFIRVQAMCFNPKTN